MKSFKSLMIFLGSVVCLIVAVSVSSAQTGGTWVLTGSSGNVTVALTYSGTQNRMVNLKVSRPNSIDHYYRGIRNVNNVEDFSGAMDLYSTNDATHGGTFVASVNSGAPGGTLVSVPGYSFYADPNNHLPYQAPQMQTAITIFKADVKVLTDLQRLGVGDIGWVIGATPHVTNEFNRVPTFDYQIVQGPPINPGEYGIGWCVFWCEVWHFDCSAGERACVSSCELENDEWAVEWRQKCGVPRPWVKGQVDQ